MYISSRKKTEIKLANDETSLTEIVIVYWDALSIFHGENKVFIVSVSGLSAISVNWLNV